MSKDHQKNVNLIDCDMCDQKFCHQADYSKHKIIEHLGGAIDEDEEYDKIFKQKIFTVNTGLNNDKDYKEIIEINKTCIEDKTVDRKVYMTVNKQINSEFTYKDLKDLIWQALNKHKTVMKFNIGFGVLLQNIVTKKYRYFYVSNNHMLFKSAKTINSMSDVKDIVKEIYDMNITEHYFMLRPTSSWTLVSITNVYFKLFNLFHPLG